MPRRAKTSSELVDNEHATNFTATSLRLHWLAGWIASWLVELAGWADWPGWHGWTGWADWGGGLAQLAGLAGAGRAGWESWRGLGLTKLVGLKQALETKLQLSTN